MTAGAEGTDAAGAALGGYTSSVSPLGCHLLLEEKALGTDCQEVNCPEGKRSHPGVRRFQRLTMTVKDGRF